MSQENVEIVRRVYAAFARSQLDQVAQLAHPDVELHGTVGGVSEGSVARGLDAVRQTFEQWDAEAWDQIRIDPEEFIDAGDRVLVMQHEFRRGRGSGAEVESHTATLFEIRDGRVVRIQGYMDREKALKAAGLTE